MPWTRKHRHRIPGRSHSPVLTTLYLLGEYYRLLPTVQALKREHREADFEELVRDMPREDPLPPWLARYGYRPFIRRLLTQEPSETTLYILGRRHGYKPHTIKRYITVMNRAADAAGAAARKARELLHPK